MSFCLFLVGAIVRGKGLAVASVNASAIPNLKSPMHEIELAILTPRTSTLMEYKEEGSAFFNYSMARLPQPKILSGSTAFLIVVCHSQGFTRHNPWQELLSQFSNTMMMGKSASTQQYLISRRLLNFCVQFRRIFYAFEKVCKIEIYRCSSIVNLCDPASADWVPRELAKCMLFFHSLFYTIAEFKNTTLRYRCFE
jgi:hypothetical protein